MRDYQLQKNYVFSCLKKSQLLKKQNEIDKELSLLFKNLERKDWGKRLLTSLKDKDPEAHYYPITYEFVDKSRAQLGCYSITSKTFLKIGVYILEFGLVIRE